MYVNEILQVWIDFVVLVLFVEDFVMFYGCLNMVQVYVGLDVVVYFLCGYGLVDCIDIVFFVFDGKECCVVDGVWVDYVFVIGQFVQWQCMFLEYCMYCFQVEFGWQVGYGEIFFVEIFDLCGLCFFVFDQMVI